ncbi:MAG: putative lactoylglutathione lyase [Candidatus Azotimanducaceae bacterium]
MTKPSNGEATSVGNGVMVALMANSTEQVVSIYNKAIELGGVDEGAPGPRGDSGFYAGYFRDLDGNKLNVFCMS